MLTLIVTLKAVVEVALLALAGRAALGWLVGTARDRNAVYQLFDLLSRPPLRVARCISPRVVQDRHIPWVATLFAAWIWLGLAAAKVSWCAKAGSQACT